MINLPAKTLPELMTELKDELKEFAATRVAMLRAEIREKGQSVKLAAPGIVAGLLLLVTAWLLFTAFLVSAIASAFETPWKYPIALAIVALLYSLVGSIVLAVGWSRIKANSLKPERTLRVLKQDQIWLQTEVKTQL